MFFLIIILLLPFSSLMGSDYYDVQIKGNAPESLIDTVKSNSQLFLSKEIPVNNESALRQRAAADLPNLMAILHNSALFNAKIDFEFNFSNHPWLVMIHIETGPVYSLKDFHIHPPGEQPLPLLEEIPLKELGIILDQPAYLKNILAAEELLIKRMAASGYPLAKIVNKEVIADQSAHTISAILYLDSGPLARYGDTTITGLSKVDESVVRKKIAWNKGDTYNPCLLEQTQAALEASGLFSSISISHSDQLSDGEVFLPIVIDVAEARHRSIGWGLAYNTERGPGVTAEWEHRNFRERGERLRFNTTLWERTQDISLIYVTPDYLRPKQDLLWIAECHRDKTRGFTESSFSLSRIIERQWSEETKISYGMMYKALRDTRSEPKGDYSLFKTPLHLRWSNANSLLDPTRGATVNLRITPSAQLIKHPFIYSINTLVTSFYLPLSQDARYVLASKVTLGSILGSSRRLIPASERFYEGTESTLRGYRYLTVSPLNEDYKPIGGRSMMIYSGELRVRASDSIGWALFYEIGNVYSSILPRFDKKLLQSAGFGIRYHTLAGPLRFDIAFPLTPRRHIDKAFQVYLSIGQAF